MATVKLGNKGEGSIIKLKENGALVDFYIARQNYEGSGRILVVRKDCYDIRQWHKANSGYYASSTIDTWLNGDYKALLDPDIQEAMGTTNIFYIYGPSSSTRSQMKRAVFLLSSTELGFSVNNIKDGTTLSSNVIDLLKIAYLDGSPCSQWTRTRSNQASGGAVSLSAEGNFVHNFSTYTNGSRPAFTLPSDLLVDSSGEVSIPPPNTAPTTPGSITVPEDISGGTTITISWTASTDAESNLEGYIVQCSINGGSSWKQIYQGSARSTTNTVAFGTASIMYRVKAYDTEGLESGWRTSAQRIVLNNRAPGEPPSITVPDSAKGGGVLTVSWTAAVDSDGNLSGYELERSVNGSEWSQVYRGAALTYTDSITKGWASVAYQVRAYDIDNAYSGYTTGPTRTVDNNTAPVITSGTVGGTDLGVKAEGFHLTYQVTDADNDTVTVMEYLDNTAQRAYTPVLGAENIFQAVTAANFQRVLNGPHTLKVTASDGKESAAYSVTFTKAVHAASITLVTPMDADDQITVCALSVTGSIPADAAFQVEVTNNARDIAPVWEDCTSAVRNGANHIFVNQAAAQGFAFNFRVNVSRGPSGHGGYITSIQGGFQ